jgi:hypothetical protein
LLFDQYSLLAFVVAGIASICLSVLARYRADIVNPDAICYLQSAATIESGGLRQAMHLCSQAGWPLYSLLIYLLAKFSQLSQLNAAYILDGLCSLITVLTFMQLVRQLGGRTAIVLWCAALVILSAHEFNVTRQYLIRDHGFWAGYLLSIKFLLDYLAQPRWLSALAWSVSLLVAMLFRIEGMVFLLILPWLLCLAPQLKLKRCIVMLAQLYLLLMIVFLVLGAWLIKHPEISLARLGRLQELVLQMFHAGLLVWQQLQHAATNFAAITISPYSLYEAKLVFFLAVLAWYCCRVIGCLSIVYAGLLAYGLWRRSLVLPWQGSVVLRSYICLNVLITLIFLLEQLYMTSRYLMALILTLMLWLPFVLAKLYSSWQLSRVLWRFWLLVIVIIVIGFSGIINRHHSKLYIRQAGEWLASHLNAHDSLYANDLQLMYYSDHFGQKIFQQWQDYSNPLVIQQLAQHKWRQYRYLALKLPHAEQKILLNRYQLKMQPLKVFMNYAGDQVRIYRLYAPDKYGIVDKFN